MSKHQTARSSSAIYAALCLLLGVAACSGIGEPEPGSQTPTQSLTAPPDAALMKPLRAGNREGQYGASLPSVTDGDVVARIPRGAPPASRYRSEVFWEDAQGEEVRVHEGERLRCQLRLTPKLGASAQDQSQWQVMWQLHGPENDGDWPQPPLNLHVRGGSWRIGGGAGRVDGKEAYYEPFSPYTDGETVTWTFDVSVSSDPAQATVDAWLGQDHVVRAWHPPSGTRYPQHEYLTVKAGLYAGADTTQKAQTESREVTVNSMRCSISRAANTTPAP